MISKILFFLMIVSVSALNCTCLSFFRSGSPIVPEPPYGRPNKTAVYISGGYKSVTYIYCCQDGHFRSITFTRMDACSGYERSDYTSDCI